MKSSPSLQKLTAKMRSHVRQDPHGDLPMWWRLNLWRAMEEEFKQHAGLRRTCVALHVFDQLLPCWETAEAESENIEVPPKYFTLPRTMVEVARHYLQKLISKSAFDAVARDYSRHEDHWLSACEWEEIGNPVFIYQAARFVMYGVQGHDDEIYRLHNLYDECDLKDVSIRPTEEYLGDPFFWDVHFIGSIIAANGAYWEVNRCDNELRRQYWLRWLDVTLPFFIGSLKTAKKMASLE
jgi:hypothetical protein